MPDTIFTIATMYVECTNKIIVRNDKYCFVDTFLLKYCELVIDCSKLRSFI